MTNRGLLCSAACALGIVLGAALLLAGCMGCQDVSGRGSFLGEEFTLLTWNAQTFFDARDTGREFEEFALSETGWSEERYRERLSRVTEGLMLAGKRAGARTGRPPSIAVLQEIENEGVLRDIWNALPSGGGYTDAVFVDPGPASSFGTGILASAEPVSVLSHSIRSPDVPCRPMLEVAFDWNGRALVVFACHWKSKVSNDGGQRERQAQEALLAERVRALERRDPEAYWIACGDFNQREEEFTGSIGGIDLWERVESDAGANAGTDAADVARMDAALGPAGSYRYKGEWERIDHVFVSSSLRDGLGPEVRAFAVVGDPPLVDEEGSPARYEAFSGKGYSDHLPLVIRVN